MKIDDYCRDVWPLLQWWLDRMEREGFDALRETAREVGKEGFLSYLRDHRALLQVRIGHGPERQERHLRPTLGQTEVHLRLLASVYILRCGYAWLETASTCAADTSEGFAPLDMLLRAEAAAALLQESYPTLWPFEDGTDPFGEGLDQDGIESDFPDHR